MKIAVSIIVCLISSWTILGQDLMVPEGYSIVDSVAGDLDKDGREELVVAYDMGPENGEDIYARALIIYKASDGVWELWKASEQALMGSIDGGMMGDPLEKLAIEKGILLIGHAGGSSWHWDQTDKYRYQDGEFYLIGFTSTSGKSCEHWLYIDFNLSTGKIITEKEYESCESSADGVYKSESEKLYKKGIKILLQERHEQELIITTPNYDHYIYLAG